MPLPSSEYLALDRLIERVVLLLFLLSFAPAVLCLTLPLDVLLLFLGTTVAFAMESRFVPKARVVVSCVVTFMVVEILGVGDVRNVEDWLYKLQRVLIATLMLLRLLGCVSRIASPGPALKYV